MDDDSSGIILERRTPMLFNAGVYKHESGFTIMVSDTGEVMLSPNHPMSMRLRELLDPTKWTKIS